MNSIRTSHPHELKFIILKESKNRPKELRPAPIKVRPFYER